MRAQHDHGHRGHHFGLPRRTRPHVDQETLQQLLNDYCLPAATVDGYGEGATDTFTVTFDPPLQRFTSRTIALADYLARDLDVAGVVVSAISPGQIKLCIDLAGRFEATERRRATPCA